MEARILCPKLLTVIEPFHPWIERGHASIGLERMLKAYCLRQWYGLANEDPKTARYDSQATPGFVRIH